MRVHHGASPIRAERRLGELIAAQKAGPGLAKPGPKSVAADDRTPTLADAGISKDLSSRAQKLAAVPRVLAILRCQHSPTQHSPG